MTSTPQAGPCSLHPIALTLPDVELLYLCRWTISCSLCGSVGAKSVGLWCVRCGDGQIPVNLKTLKFDPEEGHKTMWELNHESLASDTLPNLAAMIKEGPSWLRLYCSRPSQDLWQLSPPSNRDLEPNKKPSSLSSTAPSSCSPSPPLDSSSLPLSEAPSLLEIQEVLKNCCSFDIKDRPSEI